FLYLANFLSCSLTCTANSRVGVRISTWVPPCFSVFSMIGIPNAPVLPVPVCAWPKISFLSRVNGMLSSCIGVGVSNPISSSDFKVSSLTPNCLKNFKFRVSFDFSFLIFVTHNFSILTSSVCLYKCDLAVFEKKPFCCDVQFKLAFLCIGKQVRCAVQKFKSGTRDPFRCPDTRFIRHQKIQLSVHDQSIR